MSVRRVRVWLKIGGKDIYPNIADYVKSLRVMDDAREKTKSRIDVTLADVDGKFSDDPNFMKVQTVIDAGLYVQEEEKKYKVPFGKFSVTSCSGSRFKDMSISGISYVPNRANLRKVINRHFENASLRDVLSALISSAGFTPVLEGVPELVYESIEVKNQSIEDFIKQKAFELGLEFFVRGDKVIVGELPEVPEIRLNVNEPPVIDLSYNFDLKKSYSKIVVMYHDFQSKRTIRYEYETGLPGDVYKHVERVKSVEEAKRVAKGLAKKLNEKVGQVRLVCKGFPVWAGSKVILKGIKRFEGRYKVEKVSHSIDAGSEWRTNLELKLDLS